jgi:hypothetical protein
MPKQDQLRRYVADPMAFFADLIIPGARGSVRFGDAWGNFQREEFAALAPSLLAVANGQKPPIGKYWWERTKGASKDSDLAVALLWLLAFSRRPLLCQVGAADQDQAGELRKAAADVLRLNPWLAQRVTLQAWKLLAGDSTCEIIASDVAGSHGARPDVLILNELSHITREEFAANLMDNAAKVPHGLVCIATNAGFIDTWQEAWRKLAIESDRWRFHKWAEPAPWLDPADIEEARKRNPPARYLRLWWGIWASGAGDALDADDLKAAISLKAEPMRGNEPFFCFVGGLDLGVRRDHSAIVILGHHWKTKRVHLAHCESWAPLPGRQVDLPAVQERTYELARQFRCPVFYDPWQAELMAEQLRRRGSRMIERPFVGKNLNEMAVKLLEMFRERRVTLYDDPPLIRDLGRLSIVERSFGFKIEAPKDAGGGHCDRGLAFAIALPGAVDSAIVSSGMPWGGMSAVAATNRWAGAKSSGPTPMYGESVRKLPF